LITYIEVHCSQLNRATLAEHCAQVVSNLGLLVNVLLR